MWKYEIRLGNGELVRDSMIHLNTAFKTKEDAEKECQKNIQDIIDCNDSDDKDKWTECNFRSYTTEIHQEQ